MTHWGLNCSGGVSYGGCFGESHDSAILAAHVYTKPDNAKSLHGTILAFFAIACGCIAEVLAPKGRGVLIGGSLGGLIQTYSYPYRV